MSDSTRLNFQRIAQNRLPRPHSLYDSFKHRFQTNLTTAHSQILNLTVDLILSRWKFFLKAQFLFEAVANKEVWSCDTADDNFVTIGVTAGVTHKWCEETNTYVFEDFYGV